MLDAEVERVPEILDVAQAERLHVLLHGGRSRPDAAGDFVAAHVDMTQRRASLTVHRAEIHHDALDEAVGRLEGRVHHVIGISLHGFVLRLILGIAEPVL